MLEALTLHFQPAYLNILPLYVVLLLIFALALPLLRWPPLLAGLSLALYSAARIFDLNLPSWTGGGWFFNPFTWQLLFMMGAILSFAPGKAPKNTRVLDVISVLIVLFGIVMQWVVWQHPVVVSRLPATLVRALMSVDKEGLHPFRLISILALTWLTTRLVPYGAKWLRTPVAGAFVLAGQHSLPVFCAGIFMAFLGRITTEMDSGLLAQIGVNVVGAASLWAVGAIAAWYGLKARSAKPPPAAEA
jgi:hypothetical protein